MSDHTECHNYCEMISEFIDGELPKELCTKLEEHLAGCTNCTVVLNTMQKTIDIYHETNDSLEIPENVKKRLFSSLSLSEYMHK